MKVNFQILIGMRAEARKGYTCEMKPINAETKRVVVFGRRQRAGVGGRPVQVGRQ